MWSIEVSDLKAHLYHKDNLKQYADYLNYNKIHFHLIFDIELKNEEIKDIWTDCVKKKLSKYRIIRLFE